MMVKFPSLLCVNHNFVSPSVLTSTELLQEYRDKPVWPAPLVFFADVFYFARKLRARQSPSISPAGDGNTMSKGELEKISVFQERMTDNYCNKVSHRLASNSKKLKIIQVHLFHNTQKQVRVYNYSNAHLNSRLPTNNGVQAQEEVNSAQAVQVCQTLRQTDASLALLRQLQDDNLTLRASLEQQWGALRTIMG